MKLFFENITQNERIPIDSPLEAILEQAMDLFEQLPEDDGSSFGLLTDENLIIHFYKFNRFMWRIEIPYKAQNGFWQAVCNRNQVKRILKDLFSGVDPFSVCKFEFEPD